MNATLTAERALAMAGFVARMIAGQGRGDPSHDPPRARAARHRAACSAMCTIHAIDARVTGALPAQPAVLVANHVSYVDPLVVGALVSCVGVAKAEARSWPVIGERLRELGVMFVRRGDAHSGARVLRSALAALADGASVLNFPEGTTTRGDHILPFRRGIFGVARIAGAPIIPVCVAYDDPRVAWVGDDTLLPHYAVLAGERRITARVHFGRPIAPRGSAMDLAARAREAIAAHVLT
jgi:1-acyl-sn-glycerol-3-phosphate acyltransferase